MSNHDRFWYAVSILFLLTMLFMSLFSKKPVQLTEEVVIDKHVYTQSLIQEVTEYYADTTGTYDIFRELANNIITPERAEMNDLFDIADFTNVLLPLHLLVVDTVDSHADFEFIRYCHDSIAYCQIDQICDESALEGLAAFTRSFYDKSVKPIVIDSFLLQPQDYEKDKEQPDILLVTENDVIGRLYLEQ